MKIEIKIKEKIEFALKYIHAFIKKDVCACETAQGRPCLKPKEGKGKCTQHRNQKPIKYINTIR